MPNEFDHYKLQRQEELNETIDSLRKECERQRKISDAAYRGMVERAEKAEQERDTYREALEKIAVYEKGVSPVTPAGLRDIAKAALKGGKI